MTYVLLAQQASDASVTDFLLKGGPFAVVVALAVTGQIRFKPEVDALHADKIRLAEEKRRLETQVDAYIQQYENVVLPTIHDSVSAIREISKAVEQSTAANAATAGALGRLESVIEVAEKIRDSRNQRPEK